MFTSRNHRILRRRAQLLLALAIAASAGCSSVEAPRAAVPSPPAARESLRVHPRNPRYFTDGAREAGGELRAVYLTGSHTWNNLVDKNAGDRAAPLDYVEYLDFLERHGHNFIRLWTWDSFAWDSRANAREGTGRVFQVSPLPWARTGPGEATDGGPKFDLTRFDAEYFDRLRTRVRLARERGMYVAVMLFEGWGMFHANRRRAATAGWAWRSHPFHPANNINGIDAGGDDPAGGPHRLGNAAVNAAQAAYIRKVIDTVGEFDNVLYEVANEGGNKAWDWWVVRTVKDYQAGKPRQHPIGITGHGAENLEDMLASEADWISPGKKDGYGEDPPAWMKPKVSILDTDHIWGVGGNPGWVWKSFVRGHNPIFMDPYGHKVLGRGDPLQWEPVRASMGVTRRLAERLPLARMVPRDELASTGYCLAAPGEAYVVYLPEPGEATLELTGAAGRFEAQWLHPVQGTATDAGAVEGGASRTFKNPLVHDAVLVVRRKP